MVIYDSTSILDGIVDASTICRTMLFDMTHHVWRFMLLMMKLDIIYDI